MNISLNWLKRYIDIDMSVDRISEILTDIGLEVEGVTKVESIKGGLEGIVVGHVVECRQHPNADKLSLTKVNIGSEDFIQVVCGAPNVAQGQNVLVATIGTTLYNKEGEPWKIKKGKIRGEVSEGMICAEDEVGIGNIHDGIMVLDESVAPGTLAKEYFNIEDDYVFDIGLTPNRSDATSHLGVAKDLAAYLKINEDWEGTIKDPDVSEFHVEIDKASLKVKIENVEACPRYTGISLSNIQIGSSPEWMQNLLKSIGVRPINNVVDITNFVLHELGQPLHAFDAAKIGGSEIRVKTLAKGTLFMCLDEQERKLHNQDLMICDGHDKPMCIAGVFGGLNSGVTDSTSNIFLESAHFNAGFIRRTSTKHLLRTDAAKIFEKGSDPNITKYALKRAALLLKKYAGATITSQIVDDYPVEIKPKEIHLKYAHVNRLIGTFLGKEEVHEILRSMDMEISPVDDENIIVRVPTNKADVLREVDVIEEILRIYGFNKVPIPSLLKAPLNFQNYPTKNQIKETIADYLAHNGFNEMMGMSLVESKHYSDVEKESFVQINNTSNVHLDVMRPDALISGLQSVAHNINHQQVNLRLFEYGRYYLGGESFKETEFLSLFVTGDAGISSWNNAEEGKSDFFTIKKWVTGILNRINLSGFQIAESENANFDYGQKFHRGPSVLVEFGKLKKSVCKKAEVSADVFYACFNLKPIIKGAAKAKLTSKPISKYPSTSRDLALVLEESVKFEQIVAITMKVEKKLITDISLFDIYKNAEHLGEGKKSYAIKFTFQDFVKTLKDKEIDKVMTQLINNFEQKLAAVIRS